MNSKLLSVKLKIGVGIGLLILAVGSFLAANSVNEMQVEDTQAGNISVEFKDADIQDVFRVLALKGNISIVADPDVKGLVTVQITDVPWERVLDVICRTYGYAYEREGNIIRVTTLDKQGLENLVTEVFTLSYAKAEEVAAAVEEMKSERGRIKSDPRANLVIVTDIPTNIYKIGKVIERLDSMTPQVTIEAKIIETTISNSEDIGIKWNASYTASMSKRPTTFPWPARNVGKMYDNFLPAGDSGTDFPSTTIPTFNYGTVDDFSFGILDGTSFSMLLEAIQTKGNTKILSNPRITTLDNEPAEIHVGTDWPIANYSYNEQTDRFVISGWEYKSYGILLKVTPTINKNGYVTLKLHPEISDKQEEIDFQGARVPVLTTQSTDAKVMIKDGETLVIGGLIKNKTVTTKTKVPLLGDIPILGLLFTHKADEVIKNDLLIFITPHIIDQNKLAKRQKVANVLDQMSTLAADEEAQMEEIVAADEESFFEKSADLIINETPVKAETTPEIVDFDDEEIRRLLEEDEPQKMNIPQPAGKPVSKQDNKEVKTETSGKDGAVQENSEKNKGYLFRKN
ncbi:MAG: type IV pilus secretin PilQ [Candidatus Omnitrophica bacterium]|nr:type IV pilus secretin PilQ [Candidatus Omnitrophota bacterium]